MSAPIFGTGIAALLALLGSSELAFAENRLQRGETPSSDLSPIATSRQMEVSKDVAEPVAHDISTAPLAVTDQDFLRNAAAVITVERELGRIASERGETEEVRALGRELLGNQANRTMRTIRTLIGASSM